MLLPFLQHGLPGDLRVNESLNVPNVSADLAFPKGSDPVFKNKS